MDHGLGAERLDERHLVAVDDQVEVGRLEPEQRVAHRAADEMGHHPGPLGGVADVGEAGQARDPLTEAVDRYLSLRCHESLLEGALRSLPYHDDACGPPPDVRRQ